MHEADRYGGRYQGSDSTFQGLNQIQFLWWIDRIHTENKSNNFSPLNKQFQVFQPMAKQLNIVIKQQKNSCQISNKLHLQVIEDENMFLSKKQQNPINSTRYNNKRNENQISIVFTHRPQDSSSRNQSAFASLRNSGQKVLKLRANSKNAGIKMVTKQKSQSIIENSINYEHTSSKHNTNQRKKYLQNSKQYMDSTIQFHRQMENPKKPNSVSNSNNCSAVKVVGSFSKANKQNIRMIESQEHLQRKKSNQKGLVLTKKYSNEKSYMQQKQQTSNEKKSVKQNQTLKPKSARIQKPLAQNHLILNLNETLTKRTDLEKRNKLSIDFDSYFNRCKEEQQKKKEMLDNFYSQRNSVANIYPTGNFSHQASIEKINLPDKYGTIRMIDKDKITNCENKKPYLASYTNSKSKQNIIQKNIKEVQKDSVTNISFIEKIENSKRQPISTHRVNNYLSETEQIIENNHRRIMSILQKGVNSKLMEKQEQQKKIKQTSYFSNVSKETSEALTKQKKTINQIVRYSPNSFVYDYVVGKGGFGKVWRVCCKRTNGVYALKEMSKALIISKKSVPSVMNQQELLKQLKNPFLVNMIQSFQTRQNLYLLMDYLSGGDLRHHFAIKKCFSEDQSKFIVICILLGLKYLHQNRIIHRDIKPQNIVLDQKGYVRITDLGVARKWRENNSSDTSGTPGYMAPEVLCRQNHSYEADYFAVGVIAYQMMLRKRPYYGRSRKQIRDEVLAKQVQIKKQDIPDGWSLEGADFINRMIQRKPSNRLGFNGIEQIFEHPWIRNVPFQKIYNKKIQPPYIPQKLSKGESECMNYTSSEETEIKQLIAQNQIMLRQKQVQNLFLNYQHF